MINTRQLKHFLTVAELGSIAAASRALHLSQPAVTRQIHNLEAFLEVELFERHARGVELTPAGTQFYLDTLKILEQMEQAKSHATRLQRGSEGTLNIGISPQHLWLNEVQQYLTAFRKVNAEISVNLCTLSSGAQLIALREGRIDAGILCLRPEEDRSLKSKLIYQERMLLAVNSQSRFAHTPPKRLQELLTEEFIWMPEKGVYGFNTLVTRELEKLQFRPRVSHEGCDYNALLSLVSAGMGYTFVPAVTKYFNRYNVTFHEIPELPELNVNLELVWRADNPNPCLPNFVEGPSAQIRRLT